MAIGIKVKKAFADCEPDASKFFGTPTVPLAWEETFDEDEIFFFQIRLRDIAALDTENRLPHSGYLYVFLHTEDGEYGLEADVRYCDSEPELAIDDFNLAVEGFEQYNNAYLMEFERQDADFEGTRLFGEPSDWNYAEHAPDLLMQFDPLDNDMGFLDHIDGLFYLFFGQDPLDLSQVYLQMEYS